VTVVEKESGLSKKTYMSGRPCEITINIRDEKDQPISNAQIKTTIELKIGSETYDTVPQSVVFKEESSNPGVYKADYRPSTGRSCYHELTFTISDISGFISPIEDPCASLFVKATDRAFTGLREYNENVKNNLERLDDLALMTAEAGDFYAVRRDEKDKEIWGTLLKQTVLPINYIVQYYCINSR